MNTYISRIITEARKGIDTFSSTEYRLGVLKQVISVCEEALRAEAIKTCTPSVKSRHQVLTKAIKNAIEREPYRKDMHGIGVFENAQSFTNGYWSCWLVGDDRIPELPVIVGEPYNVSNYIKNFTGQSIDLTVLDVEKIKQVIHDRDIKKKMAPKNEKSNQENSLALFDLGQDLPRFNADYLLAAIMVLPGPIESVEISKSNPSKGPIIIRSKESFSLICPFSKPKKEEEAKS